MGWVDQERELDAIRAWFEARSLELAVFERPNGTWRAVVTARDGTQGDAEYADGSDQVDAARRARNRHSTRQLRFALTGVAELAQSEVVQLLIADVVVARMPGGRTRTGRRAALMGTVWMLDPKRRAATRTIGRVAVEWTRLRVRDGASRRELASTALGEVERAGARLRRRIDPPR
ncbi:MAG TPA: hypothetical protein VFI18_03415 [Gaiellales bacterium]|nr:hypothetical protein [Gaiellales bacterium]